jgi:uncharacterized protein
MRFPQPQDIVSEECPMSTPLSDDTVTPWGLWATFGISLGVGAAFMLVQVLVTVGYIAFEGISGIAPTLPDLEGDGLLLSLSLLSAAPVCIGLTLLAVRARRSRLRVYLAWRTVPWRVLARWTAVAVALMAGADLVTSLAGRDPVPDFMLEAYQTAGVLPLFWFAVVVVAPLFEELFFRGFLFAGVHASRLGAPGAVVLTALAWAAVHTQYDPFEITVVFIDGLLLGLVRLRTGSTMLTFVLHALWNLVATVEVVIALHGP